MTTAARKTSQANVTLDALFDYSKIRPTPVPIYDDDDDDVQIIGPPKPSTSGRLHTTTEPKAAPENPVKVAEVVEVVDDDDWLEPPSTTTTGVHRVLPSDPTLLRIRQGKLELASLYEASMRTIEEASRVGARATEDASQNHSDSGKRENDQNGIHVETPNERQKILLKLQEQSGESHGVRICVDDKLDKLFTHYANNVGKRPKTDFVFRFDGRPLDGNKSPKDLDLEDEDIVEVHVKATRR